MPITEAVGGTPEVLMDGSARSGLDVFKAVASGARGVMICRPWVWAMTGAGARGLDQMLSTMQAELQEAMALAGVDYVAEIGPHLLDKLPVSAARSQRHLQAKSPLEFQRAFRQIFAFKSAKLCSRRHPCRG